MKRSKESVKVLRSPEVHGVDNLPPMTNDERARLIYEFNATAVEIPCGKLIHQLFEEQAIRTPQTVAVVFEGHSITYTDLNHKSNQLARFLRAKGAKTDQPIGILIDRSLEMVIGLLGILKAGAAYVPMDPNLPFERLRYVLDEVKPTIVLTQDSLTTVLRASCAEAVALDTDWPTISEQDNTNLDPSAIGLTWRNLAYVIYTSGSTGKPKGVMNEHRGVVNRLQWMQDQYQLTDVDRVLQKTPFGFDVSVWEFFWTLLNGARLIIARPEGHRDPHYLAEVIRETEVTTLHFVPSMLQIFLEQHVEGAYGSLRRVICSGEELSSALQDRCLETLPQARLSNLYGPTEAAVDVTSWECRHMESGGRVPIGRPISNIQMYVLDVDYKPVPIGVTGEIYIGGIGVGRGYLNRAELTAERFVTDPFSADPQARMYRTGDLGRWRSDGAIEYLGRNDLQVKIRGIRIELGEIEACLLQHPNVREAVVVACEDRPGDKRLVAYVVEGHSGADTSPAQNDDKVASELIGRWKSLYEETYATGDMAPDFVGWNSSYTGQPIPVEQMQEWLECTVQRISGLRPRRILEIGCGVGLLLQHLAPVVDAYHAIDVAAEAIGRLRAWISTQPQLQHVELDRCSALELSGVRPGSYDTVILNSVIQYFPDIDYLRLVLQRAVSWLAPGGRIFIGDVRHLGLLKTFHSSVELERAPPNMVASQLRARIARAVEEEEELVVDPFFFSRLSESLPSIRKADVLLKRGRFDNELVRYRYDVVLQTHRLPVAVRKIAGEVPNLRLYRDLAAVNIINDAQDHCTADGLRAMWRQVKPVGKDPESFLTSSREETGEVRVTWAAGSDEGKFDVELIEELEAPQKDVDLGVLSGRWQPQEKPLSDLGNNPKGVHQRQQLSSRLREHLQSMLPEYMLPSLFVVLKAFPLTMNGKLDRGALPRPEYNVDRIRPYEPPEGETENRLAEIWQELLRTEQVSRWDNFFELGGHSLLIVQMMEKLRRIGLSAEARLAFTSPTLADLASALKTVGLSQFKAPPNLIPPGCGMITSAMLPMLELNSEHIERIAGSISGGAANVQDIYPLAPLQEGILFHHLLDDQRGGTYVVLTCLSTDSREKLQELMAALQAVIDRHDVLRTAVFWEHLPHPVQVVCRRAALVVEQFVLSSERDPIGQLQDMMRSPRQELDLRQAPLMRLQIATDPTNERWYVVLQAHHITCDYVTLEAILAEVTVHLDHGASLPEPVPYRDHVAWTLTCVRMQESEVFFRRKLEDIDEPTAPFGLLDVHGDGSEIREAREMLEPELSRRLRKQARRLNVSTATLMHAAWALVVAHTSGRYDVVFGSVLLGRFQASGRNTLGMFINTLPLRLKLHDVCAGELIEHVQRELIELLSHEQASLALAQRCSGVGTASPLFSALLNYRHGTAGSDQGREIVAGIRVLSVQVRTNYPVVMSVNDLGDGFSLEAQTDRRVDPIRLTGYLHTAVNSLVGALEINSETPVMALSVLPEREWHEVVEDFNSTKVEYPPERAVHELFEEQVARTPKAIAVTYDERSLSYSELNEKANQLARYLRAKGVGPDQLVAICVERSLEMVVGLLGILKAGGAYVPLDPSYPRERLTYMLEDAAPSILLTQRRLSSLVPRTVADVIDLDGDWSEVSNHGAHNLRTDEIGLRPHHLAYVIYTSGSTGQPKGAMNEHRGVVNRLQWMQEAYQLEATDQVLQKTPFSFDVSVWEFFWTLMSGARLIVARPDGHKDPAYLEQLIEHGGVTRLHFVPSMLQIFLDQHHVGTCRGLRQIICSGEELSVGLKNRCLECLPQARLSNLYGPTEAAVDVTAWECHREGEELRVPIGRPIANIEMYILDTSGQPTPVGVAGELHIGGVGVGRGYWNRAELTAERFIKSPFDSDPQARLYKTGDLGKWRADGIIEYLGRNDHQVKIRGVRIELGEIEALLAQHERISEVVVAAREDVLGERRLVAYVVGRDAEGGDALLNAEDLSAKALRVYLNRMLPEYMVPSAFVRLDGLPLTPNGKLDRRALPAPEFGAYATKRYEAPEGEVEEILAIVWQGLLRVERIGRWDNFFELGGHSLMVVKMLGRLQKVGLSVEVRLVFQSPTLADLASRLTGTMLEVYETPRNLIPEDCQAITPQMLPLVELERQHIETITQTVPGGAANIQDIYPLTPSQEGLLFHHMLDDKRGDAYVVTTVLSVCSRERMQELVCALQMVINRHDVFRTAVLWEHLPCPVQVVYRQIALPVDEVPLDWDRDPLEQFKERIGSRLRRIDLQRAPLMRIQMSADPHGAQWYALLQVHHITCDHVTFDAIVAEVVSHLNRSPLPLDALPYRNHVSRTLARSRTHDSEAFFRDRLAEVYESTAPFGLSDVRGDGGDAEEASQEVERNLSQRLRSQSRRVGVSAATLFHAAWAMVVAGTSGRDDVVYGTVLLGRLQGSDGVQRSLGMFVNTLPMRVRLQGLNARELVECIQRELIELLSHEQASLVLARRCSGVDAERPLFSALLNYRHSTSSRDGGWNAAQGVHLVLDHERTNYPIVMSVDDFGDIFLLTAQTDRRVDPRRVTGYLLAAAESLVQALEETPNSLALSLSIMPMHERLRVTELFNTTKAAYPTERPVHELFEEQVKRTPHGIAVVYNDQSLTYLVLNHRANRLARYLKAAGVVIGDYVPLVMPRSLEMLVAQLAVLKIGAVYVPVDPQMPVARQAFIICDCGAQHVVAKDEPSEGLENISLVWIDCVALDSEMTKLSSDNLRLPTEMLHPAYVMYTSGSTGEPKGVVVPQRAIVRLVVNTEYVHIEAADRISHCSNPSFDASTFEIWGALLNGAAVVIIPQSVLMNADSFAMALKRHRVTILWLTVGLLAQYVEAMADTFWQLRYLLTGGDVVDPGVVRRVMCQARPQHLLNAYGPTECTTFSITHNVESTDGNITRVPIGRPVSNTRIYIFDRHLKPVPIGVSGEIYIAGDGVALGYLNRPELTAEHFVADPVTNDPVDRAYKTGDMGEWRPDGTIEYLGRNDYQVKVRGFRVELGEIEAQLTQQPQVREAIVLARQDVPGSRHLVAYIVPRSAPESGDTFDAGALRTDLMRVLPEFMVPSVFVTLTRVPLTPNGKPDRAALPVPGLESYLTQKYEPPQGVVEIELATVWQELLGVEKVGREDNFFDLGGHSLLVLRLLSKIGGCLGSALSISDIYGNPSLRGLSTRIQKGTTEDEIVDLSTEASLDSSMVAQPNHRVGPELAVLLTGGSGFVGRFLLSQLVRDTDATIYCLVRGRSTQQSMFRLRESLEKWNLWNREIEARIVVIPGDLTLPRLGIDDITYAHLAEHIDTIYHCATSMNHLETYTMAKRANVDGSLRIVELATMGKAKLINAISTLSVFAPFEGDQSRIVSESTSVDQERHFASNGYAASKWVGERIFSMAAERGIACNIYRLGLVWADTQRGRYDDLQREHRLFKSCLLSGFGIKDYRYEIAPTPVDYVSRAVVFLSNLHRDGHEIFHISSSQQGIRGIFERCNEIAGTSLEMKSSYEWICEIRRLHRGGWTLPITPLIESAFSMDVASLHKYELIIGTGNTIFDCDRTQVMLEGAGIIAPVLNDDLLKLYLEDLLSRNEELRTASSLRRLEVAKRRYA